MSVRCIAFVIAVALTLLPSVLSAGVVSDEHLRAMQEVGGAVEHPTAPPPLFYQEHTFWIARDARHGATINKAFRLEGITEKNFTHVEGESKRHDIPDSDRIFLDEEAAQELTASEIPVRSVGFCRLKGFSGLHRVFEVQWENCP